ncbi:MAG: hypothetical protein JSR80_00610 [Verrucomicrobia bacterium]|nr:hypothetical protein [Verrucomicrobiota bacterium]
MSGEIFKGEATPGQFDIKIPGAAKGPSVGYNIADAIVATLKEILDKFKGSLNTQNQQIATVRLIATQIANTETLLSDIGTLEGESDPQGLADQINTGCDQMLTTIQKIDNPEVRTELTTQVDSIQAMLSSGGALGVVSTIENAMKGFDKIMNEIISGKIGPNDLSVLGDFYNDYQTLVGAVGYKGKNSTIQELIKSLQELDPKINIAPLEMLDITCTSLLGTLQEITVVKNYEVQIYDAMRKWAEGDKSRLQDFVKEIQEPGSHVYGWNKAQDAINELNNVVIPAVNKGVVLSSGDVIKAINAMINNTYGLSAGSLSGIWEGYVAATTSANNIVSQMGQISNQQATKVQASVTAMQSLVQSMEKDLQMPMQLINKSISNIL